MADRVLLNGADTSRSSSWPPPDVDVWVGKDEHLADHVSIEIEAESGRHMKASVRRSELLKAINKLFPPDWGQ